MATFQYEALDTKTGKTEKGEMPANSQAEALSRLQEMGLAPTSVEEAKPASKAKKKKKRAGGNKKGKKNALDIQIGTGVNEKSLTIRLFSLHLPFFGKKFRRFNKTSRLERDDVNDEKFGSCLFCEI